VYFNLSSFPLRSCFQTLDTLFWTLLLPNQLLYAFLLFYHRPPFLVFASTSLTSFADELLLVSVVVSHSKKCIIVRSDAMLVVLKCSLFRVSLLSYVS